MIAEGFNGALAGAGTTLDLTVEAAMQLVFTLMGLALLSHLGLAADWVTWVEGGLVTGLAALAAFIVAQRAGLMRLIERLMARLQRMFPRLSLESLTGLHVELLRLQNHPLVILKAALLQLLSWSGGALEVYLGLLAMGHPLSLEQAFVIECLGMAARSAGFAVPGALGVQEGGFILVGALFGVAPELALALSMLKRVRELAIGAVGLTLWQWAEIRRWLKL
jgi:putative membrane protein